MHQRFFGRLAAIGLAVAWLCTSAASVVAQSSQAGAPAALQVKLPDPAASVGSRIDVWFSEPMVAEAGGEPASLDFRAVPDVPVACGGRPPRC